MIRTTGLVGLAAILFAVTGCANNVEPEPIAIGQLVPLSGPQRGRGEQARKGAALALAQNSAQRIAGRRVVVRHVDDRGDGELAQAEAVRLVTLNRCSALLGGPEAGTCEQISRIAASYGTPIVLPADLNEVPPAGSVFCLNVAPTVRGESLANFLTGNLHLHRIVALRDPSQALASVVMDGFQAKWRRDHHDDKQAALEEWSCPNEAEWGSITERLLAAKPEAAVLAVGAESFAKLRSRLLAAGLKAAVIYAGEDRGVAWLVESCKEGPPVYAATAFCVEAELGPEGAAFVRDYQEKFGNPPELSACLAYDGVRAIVDALTRADASQPQRLTAELLAETNFPSVTGPLSLGDRRAKRKLFVVAIRDGMARVLSAIGPEAE